MAKVPDSTAVIHTVSLDVEVAIRDLPNYKWLRAQLDHIIFEAEKRLAGEVYDGRFDKETKGERILRSHNLGEWYGMELHWNQAQDKSCEAMLNCQDWSRHAWFLRGCNMKISVCERCWSHHNHWQKTLECIYISLRS